MELTYAHQSEHETFVDLQQRLERDRSALIARLAARDDGGYELTATHGHGETELAVRDGQQTIDAALQSEAATALGAVNAALARIDAGTYGRCVSCGDRILMERLVVIPEAARCITCQQQPNP